MNDNILKLCIIGVSFIFMFAMRYLPFVILGKSGNSKEFDRFIKDIFFKNGQLFLSISNIKLIPLILIILISVKFRNIGISVVSGGIIMLIALNLF